MAASEKVLFIYLESILLSFLCMDIEIIKLKLPKSLTQINNVIELIHS